MIPSKKPGFAFCSYSVIDHKQDEFCSYSVIDHKQDELHASLKVNMMFLCIVLTRSNVIAKIIEQFIRVF